MPPARIAEITNVDGWVVPGIDPSVAVEAMIAGAESLRIQADLTRLAGIRPDGLHPLRDLSPLGR